MGNVNLLKGFSFFPSGFLSFFLSFFFLIPPSLFRPFGWGAYLCTTAPLGMPHSILNPNHWRSWVFREEKVVLRGMPYREDFVCFCVVVTVMVFSFFIWRSLTFLHPCSLFPVFSMLVILLFHIPF